MDDDNIQIVNHLGYTSVCRNCSHWICHDLTAWDYNLKSSCPCKDYIPSDNLEYLEYEATRKGL